MTPGPTVFVVDDDQAVRNCVRRLVESVHLKAEAFDSAEEFLRTYDPARPGCLVLDVRMPGMSGLELQQRLANLGYSIPIVMVSGYGDVTVAVRAMKAGAVSFIEKPFNDHVLLDTIREAIERDVQTRQEQLRAVEIQARIDRLTPREREVMDLLVAGNVSKTVAAKLRLSEKTVEVHRAHVMKKLEAKSIAELVRFAFLSGKSKGNS
jgi:FixJ family two-component response regulator